MAKVRKKYNKAKVASKMADRVLKDVYLVYTDSLKGCVFYDKKGQYIIKANKALMNSAALPHKWSVFVAAFGRNQFDEYFKGEQIFTQSKYYHDDLVTVLEAEHKKVIDSVPSHQLAGVGWIGSFHGEDIPEKVAGRIFEQVEAWN